MILLIFRLRRVSLVCVCSLGAPRPRRCAPGQPAANGERPHTPETRPIPPEPPFNRMPASASQRMLRLFITNRCLSDAFVIEGIFSVFAFRTLPFKDSRVTVTVIVFARKKISLRGPFSAPLDAMNYSSLLGKPCFPHPTIRY